MSAEEQEQIRIRTAALMKRLFLYSLGIMLFWMLFTRRPAQFYQEVNGQLYPINMQYYGSQPQGPYMGQQSPYGNQGMPPQGDQGMAYPGTSPYSPYTAPSPYMSQPTQGQYYNPAPQSPYQYYPQSAYTQK